MIRPFRGLSPRIDPTAFVEASAQVIGDVVLGARSSVWFGCVVRGDVHSIHIGEETNVQDLSVLHVRGGSSPLRLGDRVTVGHAAALHGCTIGDGCLVGIGAIVMDDAQVGPDCLIAAGSLVTPAMRIPARSLVMGSPAKVKRPVNDAELLLLRRTAANYVEYARAYREAG